MKASSIKAGRTYVVRNGLQRRLVKIETRSGDTMVGYIPIDRKGNEGEMRWANIRGFAVAVQCEVVV